MKTVALFGGSFDPPHIGHEAIVEALVQLDYIDTVVLMPTFLNPFKSRSYAPASLRLQWLQEIFAGFDSVYVSSFEVDKGRKVPTIESVRHLLKSYKQVYLVLGADSLRSLESWENYDALKNLVSFIVASRDALKIPGEFLSLEIEKKVSSTELRVSPKMEFLPQKNAKDIFQYYKEKNE